MRIRAVQARFRSRQTHSAPPRAPRRRSTRCSTFRRYQASQLATPQVATPQVATLQLATPQLATPQLATPQLATQHRVHASLARTPFAGSLCTTLLAPASVSQDLPPRGGGAAAISGAPMADVATPRQIIGRCCDTSLENAPDDVGHLLTRSSAQDWSAARRARSPTPSGSRTKAPNLPRWGDAGAKRCKRELVIPEEVRVVLHGDPGELCPLARLRVGSTSSPP
jgi:hypothetical protein